MEKNLLGNQERKLKALAANYPRNRNSQKDRVITSLTDSLIQRSRKSNRQDSVRGKLARVLVEGYTNNTVLALYAKEVTNKKSTKL